MTATTSCSAMQGAISSPAEAGTTWSSAAAAPTSSCIARGDGLDVVGDFSVGYRFWILSVEGDTLRLGVDGIDGFEDAIAAARQVGPDTVFDFGDGDVLTLAGTRLTRLDAADLEFV